MRILGIDQSFTSTGLVVFEGTKMIHCETFCTSTLDPDRYYRAYMVANHIRKLCKEWEINHIVMEGLAYSARGDVTRDLGGLFYAIIIEVSIKGGIPITVIAPNTLKKFGANNGKASKQDMVNSLPPKIRGKFEELGYLKTTGLYDLCDAYWLGRMAEDWDFE